jgi:hypothetical protein
MRQHRLPTQQPEEDAMSSTDTSPSVARRRLPFRAPAIAVAHFIVSADVGQTIRPEAYVVDP